MKSKLVILSLMLAGAASTATAQTKKHFVSESWKDNFFISVGAGAQVCVNPDNSDYGLGKAITPLINVSVGKLINPVWGIRGQVAGAWSTLYSNYGLPEDTYNKQKNKNYFTMRFDAMYNLSNAIWGYNPDRVFNFSVFAGPGLTFAKTYGDMDKLNALLNGSVGLMGQFNINKYWDINIEARGEVSPSMFGKYSSAHVDGAVSLMAGATYTFGGKNFVPFKNVDEDALNDVINRYREELAKANADLEAAKRALAEAKSNKEVKEIIKDAPVAGPVAVFFKIGKSEIDEYGQVNLKLVAKVMKQNPDKKYKIAGYADKATGSAAINKKLADARAKAVCDALIKEGVSEDQLEPVGHGGTDNMFGKNYLNRVVILE